MLLEDEEAAGRPAGVQAGPRNQPVPGPPAGRREGPPGLTRRERGVGPSGPGAGWQPKRLAARGHYPGPPSFLPGTRYRLIGAATAAAAAGRVPAPRTPARAGQ